MYAIGEIALYNNFIYGLIAPGYTMANVAAKCVADDLGIAKLDADDMPAFTGADMSTKLKLLGCDVASFGVNQPAPDDEDVSELVWNDPFQGRLPQAHFQQGRYEAPWWNSRRRCRRLRCAPQAGREGRQTRT